MTQGFRLVGGLAKMVGKVPLKFVEQRRGGVKDLWPRAVGYYCAMEVILSWVCVVVVLWFTAEQEMDRARELLYRFFRLLRR